MKYKRSDAQLGQLRKTIAEVVQELVLGTPNIGRALLQGIDLTGFIAFLALSDVMGLKPMHWKCLALLWRRRYLRKIILLEMIEKASQLLCYSSEWAVDFTMDHSGSRLLIYTTWGCGVHLWDLRHNSNAWTLKAVPKEGYVSSVVTGPCGNWFVSVSSRGVFTLLDL
ncbi:hypothetical protein AMTR_s00001p00186420 [Amborella trichopoda]|uniref:Uncharacterized protein n=1 Tax=Amborella trichopoda TaxID=13333 RepID=W1NLF0_AMBTC|nr:hypothetical protein AMTR_s00001p00186420 [Amborella trichopoda]